MSVSYDIFTDAFLSKITEYDFITLPEKDRTQTVDGYMKRAAAAFKKNCKYDLSSADDEHREYTADIGDEDIDEIADIISEGMVVYWLKPYLYNEKLLRNVLNTRDYTQYSPSELLRRVGSAHKEADKDFKQKIFSYSYDHGDLSDLHL